MNRKIIADLIVIVLIALVTIFSGCFEKMTSSQPALQPTVTPIPDSDGDGWGDEQEKIAGTHPYKKDTDDDSYWDPNDPNPLDPNIPVSKITRDSNDPNPLNPNIPDSKITPTIAPTKIQTPKTIYVDDDFEDEPKNSRWNTIQEGIKDAEDGDMIIVYNGTYHENVVVDKSVILKGTHYPVIAASHNGDVLTVTADHSKVSGFKLINSGEEWPNSGITIHSNSNTIEGNIVFSNYCGVSLWESSNNVLSENEVFNSGWEGIYLTRSSNNVIAKNIVSNSKARGILVEDTSINNTLSENDISGNGDNGIALSESVDNKIIKNSIHNNGDGIQLYKSMDNTLSENDVRSNHNNGFALLESVDNKIIRNTVLDNFGSGILVSRSSNTLVYHNNLDNDFNGIDDTNNNFWDNGEKGNYWSNYIGKDIDGDGIGDAPYLIPGNGNTTDDYPLMKPIL